MVDQNESDKPGVLMIVVGSYSGLFAIIGASIGGVYGVAKYIFMASPGTESSMWAIACIPIGLLIGGTISLLFFGMPAIAFTLFSSQSNFKKIIGVLALAVFGGAVYFAVDVYSTVEEKKTVSSARNNQQRSDNASRGIVNGGGIKAESTNKYNLTSSEEETLKIQCENCVSDLGINDQYIRNKVLKGCSTISLKCEKMGIRW